MKWWFADNQDIKTLRMRFNPSQAITAYDIALIINQMHHMSRIGISQANWDNMPETIKKHFEIVP